MRHAGWARGEKMWTPRQYYLARADECKDHPRKTHEPLTIRGRGGAFHEITVNHEPPRSWQKVP